MGRISARKCIRLVHPSRKMETILDTMQYTCVFRPLAGGARLPLSVRDDPTSKVPDGVGRRVELFLCRIARTPARDATIITPPSSLRRHHSAIATAASRSRSVVPRRRSYDMCRAVARQSQLCNTPSQRRRKSATPRHKLRRRKFATRSRQAVALHFVANLQHAVLKPSNVCNMPSQCLVPPRSRRNVAACRRKAVANS